MHSRRASVRVETRAGRAAYKLASHTLVHVTLGHTKLISYFWSACWSVFSELLVLHNQMYM